ncbi:MAG: hypothetical protein Fur002_13820 [Anaerolineales bacterium]
MVLRFFQELIIHSFGFAQDKSSFPMYLRNLLKLARHDFTLSPQVAVYYVTMQCNLNCAYCEDFGARRNHQVTQTPPLEDAKKILRVIRSGVDRLWLTGGEPLLHPQILDLLAYAKNELKFRQISLITNGTLLSEHLKPSNLLSFLDRLIISLDSLDASALNAVSLPAAHAENVIANAQAAAKLQKSRRFQLSLNAVITPETLPHMDNLIQFCEENKIWLSLSPQAVNNLPRYELTTSPEYRAFIKRVIQIKQRGGFILGSLSYFNMLLDQTPYECYPTLAPRILPDGWLAYPCRPMEKAAGEQGGLAVNLLHVQTWKEAWNIARQTYGQAPTSCVSCFQQCYAEPSLMQARPLEYLREKIRGVDLSAYAPG